MWGGGEEEILRIVWRKSKENYNLVGIFEKVMLGVRVVMFWVIKGEVRYKGIYKFIKVFIKVFLFYFID